ncbi:unnamed protein product [Linum tenue]|uniref:F-box domain-containing protein n=2 Tax=Linum tenue TaxID=586396 RepID=A0AAV0MSS2_9ROSI|nr:unnamed protein product [Linum tenue]
MALLRKRLRSCSEVNPSNSMISSLGDDLLTEILIRLPNYRFAFWCKPVCKRWRSLISSPSFSCRFISHHRSMDRLPALLLHTDDASDPQSAIMRFIPSMPFRVRACFKILDCFKDLLLCGFMDVKYRRDRKDPDEIKNYHKLGRTYLVCNPFTKQWMALPLAPEKPMGYEAPVTRLVCEPLSSNSNGVDQALATVDVLRAATETLKNDLMDKLLALPRPGEKLHELHDWLRILRNELCELDSQREAILSL